MSTFIITQKAGVVGKYPLNGFISISLHNLQPIQIRLQIIN